MYLDHVRDVREDVEVPADEAQVVDAVVAHAAGRGRAGALEQRREPLAAGGGGGGGEGKEKKRLFFLGSSALIEYTKVSSKS